MSLRSSCPKHGRNEYTCGLCRDDEIAALTAKCDLLSASLRKQDAEVAALRAENAQLRERMKALEEATDLCLSSSELANKEADEARAQVAALTKRCEALAGALAQVRDRAARVLSSEDTDGNDLLAALERIGKVARAALESNDGGGT